MAIIKLASTALVTWSLTFALASAAFIGPVSPVQMLADLASGEVFVASQTKQNNTTRKKGHNYNSAPNSSLGYIPGYVPTPYGPGDCIGWWEPIGNGLMRCHGQFIPYRY